VSGDYADLLGFLQFVVRHRRRPEVFDAIIEDALDAAYGARIGFVPG